ENYKLKKDHLVLKNRECFEFDFGGIAKGYIIGAVSKWLSSKGYNRHLVDAGGDIVLGKEPLGQKGWKIKIEDSDEVLLLRNIAVATSGKTYQS
ncbi:MAG TPA: FAD:protein FMN transferase, partial [Saprospiraceae bacterium]|nr:FAD:protein FMN transferase [Saprospiraceae bacterium]